LAISALEAQVAAPYKAAFPNAKAWITIIDRTAPRLLRLHRCPARGACATGTGSAARGASRHRHRHRLRRPRLPRHRSRKRPPNLLQPKSSLPRRPRRPRRRRPANRRNSPRATCPTAEPWAFLAARSAGWKRGRHS
jgi:hypothetical protein